MLAAKAGMGLALLPTYLGGGEAGLAPVMPPLADLRTELWLVTHRSLKDTARVRAFMEIVGDGVKKRLAAGSRALIAAPRRPPLTTPLTINWAKFAGFVLPAPLLSPGRQ